MAAIGRLKHTLVRDAIRENVDVIDGRLPKGLRRSDRFRRAIFRASVFVIVPLALFLSINALTTGRGERTDVVVVGTPGAAPLVAAPVLHAPKGLEPSLFRLSVRSVILDPGHGGNDPGAVGAGGVKEKDGTLDVASRVKAILGESRLQVSLARDGDATLSLRGRVLLANARRPDVFVSIHVNSLPAVRDKRVVETYILGMTSDAPQALAGDENRESGTRSRTTGSCSRTCSGRAVRRIAKARQSVQGGLFAD